MKKLFGIFFDEKERQEQAEPTDMDKVMEVARNMGIEVLLVKSEINSEEAYAFSKPLAERHKEALGIAAETAIPKDGVVFIAQKSWNAEVLAHELGHKLVDRKIGVAGKDTTVVRAVAKAATVGIGLAKLARATGPVGVLAGSVAIWAAEMPRLGEEAAASYYGRKLLKEAGVKDTGIMARAYSTYLKQAALAPVTGSGLGEVIGFFGNRYFK